MQGRRRWSSFSRPARDWEENLRTANKEGMNEQAGGFTPGAVWRQPAIEQLLCQSKETSCDWE